MRAKPAALAMLAAVALVSTAARTPPAVLLRDIAASSGITFRHHAAPEKKYIVESMSGGVAIFDFDNDGRQDLYFVDSQTVDTANDPNAARSALYRNLGGGRFEDVSDRAGVGHPGWGMGVCSADVDGDGWTDLYITALGRNRLYRNNHDGTFEDIAEKAHVTGGGWSAGCGFADYDRDGRLDLFVSRYVHIDLKHLPEFGTEKTCQYRGIAVQCGPRGLEGESDLLFHNEGNGTFHEVSAPAGVADQKGYFGLGLAWVDVNDDGWLDLFVANDSTPNYLYMNQRNGTFVDMAFPMGVAVSEDGAEQGGMGVAVGDYRGTGRFSLFITNFAEEYNALYRNDGDHFTDDSFRSNTAPSSLPYVGWGTAFFDYDNDGLLDLIAVNGHVYPQLETAARGASAGYRQRALLYHGLNNGTFDEVASQYGDVLTTPRVSRGLAIGDLDDDGRLDVVVNDLDGAPQLLHNELEARGHWLTVVARGTGENRQAIGAVIKVTAGGRTMVRLVQSGTSYLSQNDIRQHFGLGNATDIDLVEVRWPDGSASRQSHVSVDRIVTIEQPSR